MGFIFYFLHFEIQQKYYYTFVKRQKSKYTRASLLFFFLYDSQVHERHFSFFILENNNFI